VKEKTVTSPKELIEMNIKSIVDCPENVEVQEVKGERTTVIELRVDPADIGKVIGRHGKTATALRTILNAAGMKLGKRYMLEILE
jgi:uncharacterized protein